MEKKNAKKRLDNLDLMKALAILAVLTLHVEVWDTDFISHFSIGRLAQYACRLIAEGVPVFLMINGYLLLRKNEIDLKRHVRKIGKILALLFIWAFILTIVGNALSPEPEPFSVGMLLRYVLGTRLFADYTGVLWFLEFLIAVYVVYPLLWKAYRDDFRIYQYIFIMLVIFSVGPAILLLLRDAIAVRWDASLLTTTIELFGILSPFGSIYGGFVWYLLYFMFGGMLCHYEERICSRRMMWVTAGILSWLLEFVYGIAVSIASGETYNASFPYNTGLTLVWVIGLFAFVLPYESKGRWIQKFISSIGENTFGIYLSHYLFLFIYHKFWISQTFGERIIELVVVFIMSYLFSVILGKLPHVKWLIAM